MNSFLIRRPTPEPERRPTSFEQRLANALAAPLSRLPDGNKLDALGRNSIHRAAAKGNRLAFGFWSGMGGDLFAADFSGDTPLHLASRRGDARMCRRLMEEGADETQPNHAGQSAVDVAAGKAIAAIAQGQRFWRLAELAAA